MKANDVKLAPPPDDQALSRRQVLKGARGVSLWLPFLPSLMPRGARAASAAKPRLVLITREHGGWGKFLHADSSHLPKRELHPGHFVYGGPIVAQQQGSKAFVSPIFNAEASLFQRLVPKLNIIRGIDGNCIGGHNHSSFGNLRTRDLGPAFWNPSIDQIVAWSPSYYAPGQFKERSLLIGAGRHSYAHANPSARTGTIQALPTLTNPQQIFDTLFMGFAEPAAMAPPPSKRKPVVDYVLDDYKRIRNGNQRLSSADGQRLDAHMEMLLEVQRRVSGFDAPPGCTKPERPKAYPTPAGKDKGPLRSPAESVELFQTYNALIAAAFKCGITRVATLKPEDATDPFSPYKGGWHGLAHEAGTDNPATEIIRDSNQLMFEKVFLDLGLRLDDEEGDGRTYLDNTLILFTNESGEFTHNQVDRLTVTLGSAGGYFNTGLYTDYRNQIDACFVRSRLNNTQKYFTGLTINQWWANVLYALQIPRSEWDQYAQGQGTGKGFGAQIVDNKASGSSTILPKHYQKGVFERAGDPLPFITKG